MTAEKLRRELLACIYLSTFINLSAMANCQYQDNHIFVLDVTDYPIVSNPVSPKADAIALERLP